MVAITRQQAANGGVVPRVPLFGRAESAEALFSPLERRSSYYREKVLSEAPPPPPRERLPIFTIPTILTIIRIVLVPVLVLCWYGSHTHAPVATAFVFITASITDWLDGYLARRWGLATAFGSFLDPVADKIMVSTALILLATQPPPPISVPVMVTPVSIIIARELTMQALREWAAASGGDAHKAVKVSSLGKWKTALQMTAMSLLLVLRNDHLVGDAPWIVEWLHISTVVVFGVLLISMLLAVWSLARYMQNVWDHFVYAPHPRKDT